MCVVIPSVRHAMTITNQEADKLRAEIAREWQRMQDWISTEAARIEDRTAAHRQDIEHRLATADAHITFIFDRLRAILASDGSDAEKLAEVENLRADFAASRSGVSLPLGRQYS